MIYSCYNNDNYATLILLWDVAICVVGKNVFPKQTTCTHVEDGQHGDHNTEDGVSQLAGRRGIGHLKQEQTVINERKRIKLGSRACKT